VNSSIVAEQCIIENYHTFMSEYKRFLDKDLLISLSPIGRNKLLISNIVKVFYIITSHNTKINNSDKLQALNDFKKLNDEYLARLEDYNISSIIRVEEKIEVKKDIGSLGGFLKDIKTTLEEFVSAHSFYASKRPQKIHKQAIIEFNNFLSHLHQHYAYNIDNNIQRGNTHLHRGTLDYYKTLIIQKYNDLTIADKKRLIELRQIETSTIGKKIDCDSVILKKNIPSKYADYVKTIY